MFRLGTRPNPRVAGNDGNVPVFLGRASAASKRRPRPMSPRVADTLARPDRDQHIFSYGPATYTMTYTTKEPRTKGARAREHIPEDTGRRSRD